MSEVIRGETTINGHCRFQWQEAEGGSTVDVTDQHCEVCVRALGTVARIRDFQIVDRRSARSP